MMAKVIVVGVYFRCCDNSLDFVFSLEEQEGRAYKLHWQHPEPICRGYSSPAKTFARYD